MPRLALFFALAASGLSACSSRAPVETGIEVRHLTVLATADVHGRLLPWDYARGHEDGAHSLLKLASLVEQQRTENEHVLLLDAGDFLQGNPFADHFAGDNTRQHPVLAVFDAMAYDAAVLGNHEFDFGLDWLDDQIARTRTPLLAGNVFRHGRGETAYPASIVREYAGVRVAVIGLTTPGTALWNRRHVQGLLDFRDGVETARPLIEQARADGADVVVALLHSGLDDPSSYDAGEVGDENFGLRLAEAVPGVDVLVLAHSHRRIEGESITGPDGRSVAVVQPGRWGSHLGVVDLIVQREAPGAAWQVHAQPSRLLAATDAPMQAALAATVAKDHDRVRAWLDEPLTSTADGWDASQARLRDTPVIDLIQHVQREVSGAQLSASAAFSSDLRFGPGAITRADVAHLYPYENSLVVLELSGQQLREYLEHSAGYFEGIVDGEPHVNSDWPGYNFDMVAGVDYRIDLRRPLGARITDLRWQGDPVRDGQSFTVALNSYRAEGSGGYTMLAEAPVIARHPESIRALIEDWLARQPDLRHEQVFEHNWALDY